MNPGPSGLARIEGPPQIAGGGAPAVGQPEDAEHRKLLARNEALLRERDARYARLEAAFRAQLAAAEAEHAALEERLSCAVELASAREDELVALRAHVTRLQGELHALLGSASWRVTGPLRGLTQRHPGAAASLRGVLRRHPGVSRAAKTFVRAGWRVLTFRQPAARSRAPAPPRPGPPSLPTPEPPTRSFEFKLAPIVPAAGAGEPALPAHGRRRALCVGHVMPYPPRAGNEYRIHRLLTWLAHEGWELLVLVCPPPGEMPDGEAMARAAAVYPNLLVLDRDGTVHHRLERGPELLPRGPADASRLDALIAQEGGEAATDPVLALVRRFCPDALVQLVLHLEGSFAPELLLAEYVFMTRPFPALSHSVRKAIDTIDVFSTKARKVERYAVSDGLAMTEAQEAALLRRADVLLAIQPEEARALAALAPAARVVSVGVDFPVPVAAPPGRTVLLVAARNPMNAKGIDDLLRFAWPIIRKHDPAALLVIAGSAGEGLSPLPDGVQAVGRVHALAQLYAAARVVINPAVAGTGLKIKTVEALCHLRPVVCWPAGVDGLPPETRRFCAIASDWFAFARHVLDALANEDSARAVLAAKDEIARAFSPERIYAPLAEALRDA